MVAGGGSGQIHHKQASCNAVKLDNVLKRFLLIEDFDHEPVRSRDEMTCEQHYDPAGLYVVRLPFCDSKLNLGKSRMQALKHLHFLERSLESNLIEDRIHGVLILTA